LNSSPRLEAPRKSAQIKVNKDAQLPRTNAQLFAQAWATSGAKLRARAWFLLKPMFIYVKKTQITGSAMR
jgi:hypothetical protein